MVVSLAWLIWAWLVVSLTVELALALADHLAPRSDWVRSLRVASRRVTAPIARRAVTAAFVVQVVGRSVVPVAAAAPIEDQAVAVNAPASDLPSTPAADVDSPAASPAYVVVAGDSLWSIAERVYGDGLAYPRIVDANVGRRMADGKIFTRQGVILPGWQLLVPDAPDTADSLAGTGWYTVEPGDTLRGIAARELGDPEQWSAIFDLNCGAARLADGHTLTSPNLIWPGLRLRLPDTTPDASADSDAAAEPDGDDAAAVSGENTPGVSGDDSAAADADSPETTNPDGSNSATPTPKSDGAAAQPQPTAVAEPQPLTSVVPPTAPATVVAPVEPTPLPTATTSVNAGETADLTTPPSEGSVAAGQLPDAAGEAAGGTTPRRQRA